MRVMVLIKANEQYEAGAMPSKELIAKMGKFNQEIVEAGVMLGGDGFETHIKGRPRGLHRRRASYHKRPVLGNG